MSAYFTVVPAALSDADLATLSKDLRDLQLTVFAEQAARKQLTDDAVAYMQVNGGDYPSAVAAIVARKQADEKVRAEALAKMRAADAPPVEPTLARG